MQNKCELGLSFRLSRGTSTCRLRFIYLTSTHVPGAALEHIVLLDVNRRRRGAALQRKGDVQVGAVRRGPFDIPQRNLAPPARHLGVFYCCWPRVTRFAAPATRAPAVSLDARCRAFHGVDIEDDGGLDKEESTVAPESGREQRIENRERGREKRREGVGGRVRNEDRDV